jgi:hypothetical protein
VLTLLAAVNYYGRGIPASSSWTMQGSSSTQQGIQLSGCAEVKTDACSAAGKLSSHWIPVQGMRQLDSVL